MQRKRKSRHALESHRHRRVGPRTHDYGRLRRKPAAVGAIAGFESRAERSRTESAVAEPAGTHAESAGTHAESAGTHAESARSDSW